MSCILAQRAGKHYFGCTFYKLELWLRFLMNTAILVLSSHRVLKFKYIKMGYSSSPGSDGGGVTQIIVQRGVRLQGLKPLPISKDFSPWLFFEIFTNSDPFLRVFLPRKRLILPIFMKWDPLSRIFWPKCMGPMLKDFWWKSNPFGQHILDSFQTCEYPRFLFNYNLYSPWRSEWHASSRLWCKL